MKWVAIYYFLVINSLIVVETPVRFRLLAMRRGEVSVVIARLMSKCLWKW